jgi:hypothetical protein
MLGHAGLEPEHASPASCLTSRRLLALLCVATFLWTALVALVTLVVSRTSDRAPVSSNVMVDRESHIEGLDCDTVHALTELKHTRRTSASTSSTNLESSLKTTWLLSSSGSRAMRSMPTGTTSSTVRLPCIWVSLSLRQKTDLLSAAQNIGVSPEYMRQLGRIEEGIQISTGDYFGSFLVFHHLHCIVSPPSGLRRRDSPRELQCVLIFLE